MQRPRDHRRALETTKQVIAALSSHPELNDSIRGLIAAVEQDRAILLSQVVSTRAA